MFDSTKLIQVNLNQIKVIIRFPSDQEWIDREERSRPIFRKLDNGGTQVIRPDANRRDADLLKAMQAEDPCPIDQYDAFYILDKLALCEITSVEKTQDYRVIMTILGGEAVHALRAPTGADTFQFERAITYTSLPQEGATSTRNLRAIGEIYDRMFVSNGGYAGAVPIIHKAEAVQAVMMRSKEEIQGKCFFLSIGTQDASQT